MKWGETCTHPLKHGTRWLHAYWQKYSRFVQLLPPTRVQLAATFAYKQPSSKSLRVTSRKKKLGATSTGFPSDEDSLTDRAIRMYAWRAIRLLGGVHAAKQGLAAIKRDNINPLPLQCDRLLCWDLRSGCSLLYYRYRRNNGRELYQGRGRGR